MEKTFSVVCSEDIEEFQKHLEYCTWEFQHSDIQYQPLLDKERGAIIFTALVTTWEDEE